MPTAGDVARSALAAVGSSANLDLAVQWVNERYADMASRIRLRHLRRVVALTIPAVLTSGTVTVARGDSLVTGDATAQATWSPALVGRFFRGRSAWYEIVDASAAGLQLGAPYTEDDLAAATYVVVQRYARLPIGARYFSTFVMPRLWSSLRLISLEEMDRLAPGRPYSTTLAAGGGWVADAGLDAEGRRVVEVYPYSTTAEVIGGLVWLAPKALDVDEELPAVIDLVTLKEGVLVDVYRNMMGKADATMFGFWRNEARAQETAWDQRLRYAARADRGANDVHLIMQMFGSGTGPRDIITAEDQVWATGSRP